MDYAVFSRMLFSFFVFFASMVCVGLVASNVFGKDEFGCLVYEIGVTGALACGFVGMVVGLFDMWT